MHEDQAQRTGKPAQRKKAERWVTCRTRCAPLRPSAGSICCPYPQTATGFFCCLGFHNPSLLTNTPNQPARLPLTPGEPESPPLSPSLPLSASLSLLLLHDVLHTYGSINTLLPLIHSPPPERFTLSFCSSLLSPLSSGNVRLTLPLNAHGGHHYWTPCWGEGTTPL